ncbi:STM4015 family protein [Paenibacillus sp. 1P07SE]|uniref:STM4015 family protein n=1 Tax=Paenibacillus sp. 1P07SE TaxID=3132209 RepID=UPI0039A76022
MSEIKLSIPYDEYEAGVSMADKLEELAGSPESRNLTSLIIGDWGGAYENDSSIVVETLVRFKDAFPSLRKLFIGDMSFEECEISWIMQSNMAPLLEAFPELQSFTVQGGTELSFEPLVHDKLEELIVITGGLSSAAIGQIAAGRLPNLRKLELYLGVDDYGFDGGLDDVLPFMETGRFPELTYLGLKNSEIQDDIAIAISDAPVLLQLQTLDLSLGALTDKGAEALIGSAGVRRLDKLDLKYHYMSDEMIQRWQATGMNVDVSDKQEDEDGDYRFPSITE